MKTVESVLASSEVGVVFGMLRDACHLAFAQDSVQRSKYESEVIDMITHAMQDMHAGAVSVKTVYYTYLGARGSNCCARADMKRGYLSARWKEDPQL